MKVFLLILSGFVTTLAVYAGGVITAVFFVNAEPMPVHSPGTASASVWTNEPVAVKASAQDFERLPARPVPETSRDVVQPEAEPETPEVLVSIVDPTVTGAIPSDAEPEPAAPAMNPEHVEWCSQRYRSYRPGDNSYTPYSGGKRECVSPFSDATAAAAEPEEADSYAELFVDQPYVGYATEDEEPGGYLSPDHVESCFARYRSYRPEDNSYQPYGGGPRRQCR